MELKEQEDIMQNRFLTFHVDAEVFGIEIEFVTEIIGMQAITKIPETKDYIKGIINLRGKIIPTIDMRLKFDIDEIPYNDRTCIIVIDIDGMLVGLIVDQVNEVLTIDEDNISEPPDHRSGIHTEYIRGVGKVNDQVKLLLDCRKLFDDEETQEITDIE